MKKRAFTLIETLVALGIIVVVLGASVTANRVLLTSSQSSEDKVQMEGIADEGVQLMQLLQRQEASRVNGSIGNYFANNTTAQWVIPFTVASANLTTGKDVDWCTESKATGGSTCRDTAGVVQICGANTKLSDFTSGELVGVRRDATGPQVYYSFTMSRSSGTDAQVNACTGATGIDFYTRTIQVARIQGPEATAWFSKSTVAGKITNKLYRVTVSVSKYLDSSIKPVIRSTILTDYYTP